MNELAAQQFRYIFETSPPTVLSNPTLPDAPFKACRPAVLGFSDVQVDLLALGLQNPESNAAYTPPEETTAVNSAIREMLVLSRISTVHAVARRLGQGSNSHLYPDLFTEGLTVLVQATAAYEPGPLRQNYGAFAYKVAYNAMLRFLDVYYRTPAVSLETWSGTSADGLPLSETLEDPGSAEQLEAIVEAIARQLEVQNVWKRLNEMHERGLLDDIDLRILVACFRDGMSQREAGEQVGMIRVTVQKRIDRAMLRIREYMNSELD